MYIIVGIDPGKHVGYAALDLNGRLVGHGMLRHGSIESTVSTISGIGKPVLIACDVKNAPKFVKAIAAKFNAKVFHPRKNMKKETKRFIARDIQNKHVQDAYAAAIKAYNKYANRFRRINKVYPYLKEYCKSLILKGQAVGKVVQKTG